MNWSQVLRVSLLALLAMVMTSNSSKEAVTPPSNDNTTEEYSTEDLLCTDSTCTITPDNLTLLQNVIGSERVIRFEGKDFYATNKEGFLVIENVTNLQLVGSDGGSLVSCNSGGEFGIHLRNATNITISGLALENCAVPVPDYVEQELYNSLETLCANGICAKKVYSTILIEDSTNVTLENTLLHHSPGFALTAINFRKKLPILFEDLMLIGCEVYHSSLGAVLLHRTAIYLIQTIITNTSVGIGSTFSDIKMVDVRMDNCATSSVERGKALIVNGALRMTQSSLRLNTQSLYVTKSHVVFSGKGDSTDSGITAINSDVYINNSTLLFTDFNLSNSSSAVLLLEVFLSQENSSLIFKDNVVSNGASLLAALSSNLIISQRSLVRVRHNSVSINAWGVLSGFDSYWEMTEGAVLDISHNNASDGGRISEFYATETIFQGAVVSLHHNSIQKQSVLFFTNRADPEFYENCTLSLTENSAYNNSRLLMVMGNLYFHNSTNVVVKNNSAVKDSGIMTIYRNISFENEEFSHYRNIVVTHREENNLAVKTRRDTNDSSAENETINIFITDLPGFPMFPCSGGDDDLRVGIVFPTTPGLTADGPLPPLGPILEDPFGIPDLDIPVPDDELLIVESPRLGWSQPPILGFGGKHVVFLFRGNTMARESVGFMCIDCEIQTEGTVKIIFTENKSRKSSYVILLNDMSASVQDDTTIELTNNDIFIDSAVVLSVDGSWRFGSRTSLTISENTAQSGFSVLFFSMFIDFEGSVVVTNNNLSDFGALNVINSEVYFGGSLECSGNIVESGGIFADQSELFFTGVASFSDNFAENGGAMSLGSSVMHVSRDATVDFTRNTASGLGGAIYITNPRTEVVCNELSSTAVQCSIQVLNDFSPFIDCGLFTLVFNQNRAGIAGNAVYGDHTSACMPTSISNYCSNCSLPDPSKMFQYNGLNDSSDLSNFTSDPTRVCFCENGIPDCYRIARDIAVYPGEDFNLSLAVVGYGLGTVPGSIVARTRTRTVRVSGESSFGSNLQYSQDVGIECQDIGYSILSDRSSEVITLAVNTRSFSRSLKEVEAVVNFQLTADTGNISPILRSPYDSLYETFFNIPIFIHASLLECPTGFQLADGRCICHQILLDNNIDTCFISDGTPFIRREPSYWIGLPDNYSTAILIHPNCPFDYCQSSDENITASTPDAQCRHQRTGVLCGGCREGLSMVLGSSDCKKCSNSFLMLVAVFILAGIALVALVTLLNMTVSVGTLNGLILFANIIQANRITFLPPSSTATSVPIAILSTFIAWLNLDLGIATCIFDGLTTYVKTWLQFIFPLYILAIVGAIIVSSKYSLHITKLFGTNTVSVLATLILLSYTKILRILITAFSFTVLKGTQDHHSVVWLPDGNVEYFQLKHAFLFLAAALVLILLVIPYTVTLTAAPWIQRSKYDRVSTLYNKCKPLFDAYMGPYKDNCRYWTGMLLLARVVLIVLFSSIANTNTVGGPAVNLLLLTLSSAGLLALTAAVKPYRGALLNWLEIFYLTILLIFSSANLYASSTSSSSGGGGRDIIYLCLVGISFLGFLGTGIGHGWYRIKTARSGRKMELPDTGEQEGLPRWRSNKRVSEEEEGREGERRETTFSTVRTTDTYTTRDSMYRESVLELNNE